GAAMTITTADGSPISKECGANAPGTNGCDLIGNLGINLTWPKPPLDRVTSYYTAARNGVDYTGPFQYPHPLTTGTLPPPTATPGETTTPTPTATSTATA